MVASRRRIHRSHDAREVVDAHPFGKGATAPGRRPDQEELTLPPEYDALIEGLTPDEVEVLIAVRTRLDEAERVSKKKAIQFMMPP